MVTAQLPAVKSKNEHYIRTSIQFADLLGGYKSDLPWLKQGEKVEAVPAVAAAIQSKKGYLTFRVQEAPAEMIALGGRLWRANGKLNIGLVFYHSEQSKAAAAADEIRDYLSDNKPSNYHFINYAFNYHSQPDEPAGYVLFYFEVEYQRNWELKA